MDLISPDEDWTAGLFTGPAIELKLLPVHPDAGADAGTIEGYASTFGGVDAHGDIVMPGAFADSLAAHAKAGTSPALLWSHRQAEPIGRLTGIGEDDTGLRFRGKLNLATPSGRKSYEHAKAGDVTGASIGYRPAPGGATLKGGIRQLHKINLHEISLVATPADMRARLLSVKSADGALQLETKAELEALLCEAGLSADAARRVAAGGWPALSGPEAGPVPFGEIARAVRAGTAALRSLRS